MAAETDQDPITKAEMIEMFGEVRPREVVDAWFNAPDEQTVGQYRAEVRRLGALRQRERREAAEAQQDTARRLRWALRGGNATSDNAELLEFLAARLVNVHGEPPGTDYILAARERAAMIRQALAHGG